MFKMRTCAIAAVCAVTTTSICAAEIIVFNFTLDGEQEVPSVDTPGWGTAEVTINTTTGLLEWDVEYHDLIGLSTAAHFHGPADFGENAGIQVDMAGPGAEFGVHSGTLIGSATIDATQIQDLLDGLWYVNIHSNEFSPGEIRGQVVQALPAPGAVALLGIATLAGCSRRRR